MSLFLCEIYIAKVSPVKVLEVTLNLKEYFTYFFVEEGKDVTEKMAGPWKEMTLPIILSYYELAEIFNADEFGSFYPELLHKTLDLLKEKCSRGKHSKIRLTGIVAARMTAVKLPVFIEGKAKNTRCFKEIKKVVCVHNSQTKSLMDSELFEECVRELYKNLNQKDAKLL